MQFIRHSNMHTAECKQNLNGCQLGVALEAQDEHTCLRYPWTAAVDTSDRLATALLACHPALEALHMHIVAALLAEGDLVLRPLGIHLNCKA